MNKSQEPETTKEKITNFYETFKNKLKEPQNKILLDKLMEF